MSITIDIDDERRRDLVTILQIWFRHAMNNGDYSRGVYAGAREVLGILDVDVQFDDTTKLPVGVKARNGKRGAK